MQQIDIEKMFSKQNRHSIVLDSLNQDKWFTDAVANGIVLLQAHFQQENADLNKQYRLNFMWERYSNIANLQKLIESILVTVAQLEELIPLVSLSAQLQAKLKMADKTNAIQSMAEILVVLSETNLFDIVKAKNGQPAIKNKVKLDEEVLHKVNQLMYLPPMVSQPNYIESNIDSYHYSLQKESMILGGSLNHHNNDIALDVLNTLSQQPLVLDQDFISNNKPTKPEGMPQEDWDLFISQSNYINEILEDRTIYLTYKTDKRGRIYAQGYHVNSQGSDYHKAVLELANKEIIQVEL